MKANFGLPKRVNCIIKLKYLVEKKSTIIGSGEVYVQESQIELNKVFLNEIPLKKLAEATGGAFYRWDSRGELTNILIKRLKIQLVIKE